VRENADDYRDHRGEAELNRRLRVLFDGVGVLPIVEPPRRRLAQFEVVIDHRREQPLHQVVRALRHLAGEVHEA
jgi:hypothetical protein